MADNGDGHSIAHGPTDVLAAVTPTTDTEATPVVPASDDTDAVPEFEGSATAPAMIHPVVACSRCRHVGDADDRFCTRCGAQLSGTLREIRVEGKCWSCGQSHRPIPTPQCGSCNADRGPLIQAVFVDPDGSEGEPLPLLAGTMVLGRTEGDLSFATDPFLSPAHCVLSSTPEAVTVEDLGSLNGTFIRLRKPEAISAGDVFVIGRQLLRLESAGQAPTETVSEDGTRLLGSPAPTTTFVLAQLAVSGRVQNRYHLDSQEVLIGRNEGQIRFPADRYVSGQHASVRRVGTDLTLADLESSNGVWLRIRKPTPIAAEDELYIGSQVIRVLALV